jgi:hypothetical protein
MGLFILVGVYMLLLIVVYKFSCVFYPEENNDYEDNKNNL